MSDKEMDKKMAEEEALNYFLHAYELVTGEELSPRPSECPDFICERPTGEEVGIELSMVLSYPRQPGSAKIVRIESEMDLTESRVVEALNVKDSKRETVYGRWAEKTILVLQLMDFPLWDVKPILEVEVRGAAEETGFLEVWLADYTGIEAYGDIELFGLKPEKYWGFHERENPSQKPYG